MKDGDTAGLAIYNRAFAYLGVRKTDGQLTLGLLERTPNDVAQQLDAMDPEVVESFKESVEVPAGQDVVHLRVDSEAVDNQPLKTWWSYSWDGQEWEQLGEETQASFAGWHPTHFMGPRVGLFNYATEESGGSADFNHLYLSDSPREQEVSTERLDAIIDYAHGLDLTAKSCDLQADVAFWLEQAEAAVQRGVFTHPQADAPVERLQLALATALAADDSEENCDSTPDPDPDPEPEPNPDPEPEPDPDPEDPTDPVDPSDPGDTGVPEGPSSPNAPGNGSHTGNNTGTLPRTGTEVGMALLFAGLLIGAGVVIFRQRRVS